MKSLLLTPLLAGAACAAVDYTGYKVYRVPFGDHAEEVNSIINSLKLSTWKNTIANSGHADIVVPPKEVATFEDITRNITTQIMHENLGASIAEETTFQAYAAGAADLTWFNSYHAYADHLQFLKDLQAVRPQNSEIFTVGKSVQGRDITGIHFWGSSKGKPAVVFHSTVHAREWITTMVNEYLAYTLTTGYASDSTIKGIVDKYDFYIIPVVNPDGFVYTQTNDRLWRKNRQTNSGSTCLGRDVNRNWNYKWDGAGSSTSPCSETYRGARAGDAPENQALASHIDRLKASTGVKLYIDWHSYSQLAMFPYGYSCTAQAPKASEYQTLVNGMAAAIRTQYGTRFDAGPICSTIYQVAGGSVDYVSDVTKADYSLTLELRDTGANGFVLPPAQIVPSGRETWDGVSYLLRNLR